MKKMCSITTLFSPPPSLPHTPESTHLSSTPPQFKATIAVPYSGVCCVCKFGFWTCLAGPCDLMEGERIPVAVGDRVIISRWKSKWFYGDRVLSEGQFVLKRMNQLHLAVTFVQGLVSYMVFDESVCLISPTHLLCNATPYHLAVPQCFHDSLCVAVVSPIGACSCLPLHSYTPVMHCIYSM